MKRSARRKLNLTISKVTWILFYLYESLVALATLSCHFFYKQQSKCKIDHMHHYIIIHGGERKNKGAQAMLYTCVFFLQKAYPNKEIVLFSSHVKKYEIDQLFSFMILPYDSEIELLLINKIHLLRRSLSKTSELYSKTLNIYRNAYFAIDISGLALSSHFPTNRPLRFLYRIRIAKKHNLPYFILPQSFGPFIFQTKRHFIKLLSRAYLKYPSLIYAREKNGQELLKNKFGIRSRLHSDIVLYDTKPSHSDNKTTRIIQKNSVGIIMNSRVAERIEKNDFLKIYVTATNKLLQKNFLVSFIRHSYEDIPLIREIENIYRTNSSVTFLKKDLDCFELEAIIADFRFIIGSRYHSIIHAYKSHVPAIALGWADKYDELLATFQQSQYNIDIRRDANIATKLANLIDIASEKHSEDTKQIKKILNEIKHREHCVFEDIRLALNNE